MGYDLISYLAGFFDGEGCITIGDNGGVTASVVNTYLPTLLDFEFCFQGTVSERKQKVNKQQYQWRVYGNAAQTFLTDILPHLREKRPQAEAALEYLAMRAELSPIRFEDKRGAFTNPQRNPLIETYKTILTNMKLGINDQSPIHSQ